MTNPRKASRDKRRTDASPAFCLFPTPSRACLADAFSIISSEERRCYSGTNRLLSIDSRMELPFEDETTIGKGEIPSISSLPFFLSIIVAFPSFVPVSLFAFAAFLVFALFLPGHLLGGAPPVCDRRNVGSFETTDPFRYFGDGGGRQLFLGRHVGTAARVKHIEQQTIRWFAGNHDRTGTSAEHEFVARAQIELSLDLPPGVTTYTVGR